jgi:Zn-dependent peptidase ImmA (M78 family)
VTYRRGFKSEANATAREIRAELGLGDLDRLHPLELAEYLAVPVQTLTDLSGRAGEATAYLRAEEPSSFSAVTVFHGSRRLIVHNDAHHPYRQNSNIAHELSHALLFHEASPALNDLGSRYWNQNIEDEANWLAGVLLLTEDATLHVVRRAWSMEKIGERFGVSPQMATWRINSTGARKRVARRPHL